MEDLTRQNATLLETTCRGTNSVRRPICVQLLQNKNRMELFGTCTRDLSAVPRLLLPLPC